MKFGQPIVTENVRPRRIFERHPGYVSLTDAASHVVFASAMALAEMVRAGSIDAGGWERREVAFLCLGRRFNDRDGRYTVIQELPFLAVGEAAHVKLTSDDKTRVRKEFPYLDVLGFAHTHPNYGVFFSSGDVATAEGFGPDGVHLVLDPIRGLLGVGFHTRIVDELRLAELGLDLPGPSYDLLLDAAPADETHGDEAKLDDSVSPDDPIRAHESDDAGVRPRATRSRPDPAQRSGRRPQPMRTGRMLSAVAWVVTLCFVGACAVGLLRLNRLVETHLTTEDAEMPGFGAPRSTERGDSPVQQARDHEPTLGSTPTAAECLEPICSGDEG